MPNCIKCNGYRLIYEVNKDDMFMIVSYDDKLIRESVGWKVTKEILCPVCNRKQ